MNSLRRLSFSSMVPSTSKQPLSVEGTQHHFTRNGRLVANKQLVYTIDHRSGLQSIGWYSEDEGLHLTASLDSGLISTQMPHSAPLIRDEDDRGPYARSLSEHELRFEAEREKKKAQLETLPIFSYESFISRTWALVVVSVAIFGVCVSLFMMFYVMQKICDGTLNGNQMMGNIFLRLR